MFSTPSFFVRLAHPALQTLALECLNKWQLSYLYPYRERLARLIAEATFREELTLFSVAPSAGQVRVHCFCCNATNVIVGDGGGRVLLVGGCVWIYTM
jgi:hypothetical protein